MSNKGGGDQHLRELLMEKTGEVHKLKAEVERSVVCVCVCVCVCVGVCGCGCGCVGVGVCSGNSLVQLSWSCTDIQRVVRLILLM